MKQERMTSDERLDALLNGERLDHVPFLSFILGFCAKNVGYTVATIYNDPLKSFQAQQRTREQYGYDSEPFYGYASYGGCEFGGEINLPSSEYEQAPSHVRFAVQKEQDLENLQMPDVKTSGMLPRAMEFSKIQVKNGCYPSIVVGGPFTVAGNVCVVDTLCRWLIKKPDLVHRLLRMTTDHIIELTQYWVDTFGKGTVKLQIWEPLATNQIISSKQFEKIILPYQIELHEKLLKMDVKSILCHICGEQNSNLPYWAQVPMGESGVISVGKEIDIQTAIKYFGDKYVIAGNIEPAILQTGSSEQVYNICRDIINKGKQSPRGYALMQGCEVPVNTPPYNLYSMRKAIEDFGWYD